MASETRPFVSNANVLLAVDDPQPVQIVNPGGRSSFLLIGDHAGNHIPARLGTLGLTDDDRARHIAWDIGVGALGVTMAETLDATFIHQSYSRLVVDCNRAREASDVIARVSDGTAVPGNLSLDPAARDARFREIYDPYHSAIARELERRDAAGIPTVLVALHSFTPAMGTAVRPWQVGILHDGGDAAFAMACLNALAADAALIVGDNEPYRMDMIDYTVPHHAYSRRRPYVEIEVRQDLLTDPSGTERWAAILTETLIRSAAVVGVPTS